MKQFHFDKRESLKSLSLKNVHNLYKNNRKDHRAVVRIFYNLKHCLISSFHLEKRKYDFYSSSCFHFFLLYPLVTVFLAFPVLQTESALSAPTYPSKDSLQTSNALPLPRFVSLKSNRVNSRRGPGINYSIQWLYVKIGIPVEILQEYDNWCRIRDADGIEGWVHRSMISGKRTGIVAPWQKNSRTSIKLFDQPNSNNNPIALLEPGLSGGIRNCNGSWCYMIFRDLQGWVTQSLIWGAYPNEKINR